MSFRSLLSRATEGTDAPTPGYLYVDLAKALTGNPGACSDSARYLTHRLATKQNPNIKFKCCKVIGKLCDQVPRNAFRRCIAQDHVGVTAIKEAMNYRGQPDPVRGDEPNQKVRIAAKECLDAVYREAPTSESMPNNASNYGGGISSQSYGAPPHSQYSGGGGGGSSRMQGIGNPRYADPRLHNNEPTGIGGTLREAGEVIAGMIKDPLARNIVPDVPRQGHSGNLPGYGGPSQYGRPPPGSAELARRTDGEWTMATNRGPTAIQSDYERQNTPPVSNYGPSTHARAGAVGGSWGSANVSAPLPSSTATNHHQAPAPGMNTSAVAASVSDGTYEKNLVHELCPPGGMKPVPPPDKLASFAKACSSLNADLVCPVLLDCLEDGQPWIIRAKALCAMETAIANGTRSDGTNPYRDFFHACQDEVAPLSSHPRSAINEPAKRVMTLLGVANVVGSPTAAAAPPVAAAPNLLDFGDDNDNNTTPAPPPQPAAAAPATSNNNMFGGMQVKSSATPAPKVQQPPAPAAVAPNLLDFDAAPTPAPAAQASSNDIFSPTEEKKSVDTAAVNSTSSMFDSLSVKDTKDNNNKNDSAPAPAANGSAFGFINESSATPSEPKPTVFDPLKGNHHHHNMTPNTAKKAMQMQMSPEQMQAMAYQQMMMQQQMQHMQMQMAMQQQGAGGPVPMFPTLGQRIPPFQQQQQQKFSFNAKPAQKDDKKFDFVKDAMQTASHKK